MKYRIDLGLSPALMPSQVSCMDEFIDTLSSNGHKSVSPNAHSVSEMREILQERIRRAEAGEEKLISNTDVFAQIDKRYGF